MAYHVAGSTHVAARHEEAISAPTSTLRQAHPAKHTPRAAALQAAHNVLPNDRTQIAVAQIAGNALFIRESVLPVRRAEFQIRLGVRNDELAGIQNRPRILLCGCRLLCGYPSASLMVSTKLARGTVP